MAVLSLYDSNNCIETGFELAGFEITTLTDAESVVSGVIGPYERVAEFVNELKPVFFVGTGDFTEEKIENYIIYSAVTSSAEYNCSRDISWNIGIYDDPEELAELGTFYDVVEFPAPSDQRRSSIIPYRSFFQTARSFRPRAAVCT